MIDKLSIGQILHLAHQIIDLFSNFIVRPTVPVAVARNLGNFDGLVHTCKQSLIICVCHGKIVNIVLLQAVIVRNSPNLQKKQNVMDQ